MKGGGRSPLGFLLALLLALSMTALAACGGDEEGGGGDQAAAENANTGETAAGTQDVEMLLSFPRAILWSPLLVAEDQGWFKDEGIDLSVEETDGAGFVTQQIIAGNADFGWAGAASQIIAFSKDPGVRALACNSERNIFSINAVPGSGVTDVSQLEGKKLGITEKGSGEEPLVDAVLTDAGLKGKVEVIPVGEPGPAVVRALQNGVVAAYSGGITDIATVKAAGVDLQDITPEKYAPVPGDCLMSHERVLKDPEKQKVAAGIIRAWTKGAFFSLADRDATLEIACEVVPEQCKDRERFTEPYTDTVFGLLKPIDESLPPTALDPQGWKVAAEVLRDSGTLEEEVDIETLIAAPEVKAVQDMAYENVDQLQQEAEQAAKQAGGAG